MYVHRRDEPTMKIADYTEADYSVVADYYKYIIGRTIAICRLVTKCYVVGYQSLYSVAMFFEVLNVSLKSVSYSRPTIRAIGK